MLNFLCAVPILLITAPALAQDVGTAAMTRPTFEPAPATTQPAATTPTSTMAADSTSPATHTGFVEFLSNRLAAYEPIYFIGGPERPNVKFQFSLRYQVINDDGPLAKAFPPIKGLNFAYSQTSFWDLQGESSPFLDTSYRPEVLLHYDEIVDPDKLKLFSRIGLQAGLQHESNGQEGLESRSVNYAYIRPMFTIGDREDGGFFITLAPRAQIYIGDLSENPDIRKYRGYGDLRLIVGQSGGLQAALIGRLGNDWENGSIQLDLSYPLRKLLYGNVDLYLHLQAFNGYGESLIDYDESDTVVRAGVSLVR
ncbi:MAG TPA: phospholipase A [Tepidisphaeraceae bacterium]|nr:phospholipase A [Tepidisphaeraceae bacterium]